MTLIHSPTCTWQRVIGVAGNEFGNDKGRNWRRVNEEKDRERRE